MSVQSGQGAAVPGRNPLEHVINGLASGLGNSIGWMVEHGVLFAVFAVIWLAFGAALVLSQATIDQAWQAIRELPLAVQVVIWVAFLPVMVGLWVWETTWPLLLRLLVVLGVAGWNLLVFLPRTAASTKP